MDIQRNSAEMQRNGTAVEPSGVGPLLRRWRESRHLSQLELALDAEVSARHISFLETGRAEPSREMLLTLSNVLDVPLRERNFLLLAAGYAPLYGETSMDDPRMTQVRAAVEIILKSNEPRSALAHDRHWNVVMANTAFVRFLTLTMGQQPAGLAPLQVSTPPRLNVLHLLFDPNGFRKIIVNWEAIAKSLLNEAYRRLAWARDETLKQLITDIELPRRAVTLARARSGSAPRAHPADGIEARRPDRADVQHGHDGGHAT